MKNLLLICSFAVILFITGCASIHTWQKTGYEVFQPESHHLEKLPDGRILLTQQGIVKEYYLPFFDCFAVESEQERKRYFSVNYDHVSLRREVVIKFRVNKNAKNVGENYAGGVLFPFTTLQLQEIPVISPRDKELLLTKPIMFLDFFYEPELFILTEYEQKSDELFLGKGRVFYPRLHSKEIGRSMEGAGFTCLRLLMMPIPVVIDIATFPFQFVALCLLH
ncbi:MAG: hypothetical protein IJW07_03120 [Lentisphaeria bacterium]|nr:hypothetical protein [Lentisphaeria bacterium]